MSFTDHKITQFTHRIVDLPDQPNLPADELKARFDSSPEELRQAVNGICDDATTLSGKVDSILAETFDGVVEKSMLSEALADEIDAKATQTALAAEVAILEAADSALSTRVSTAESTITTHTSQIAQKCEVYAGTYVGNDDPDTGVGTQTIRPGFTPKAVFVMRDGAYLNSDNRLYGGLAVSGYAATGSIGTAMQIVSNGFKVSSLSSTSSSMRIRLNTNGDRYFYLAFK